MAETKFPLNPAQREAVEHLHGPVLVIAGAGTGKTRVITERILYLLDAIPDLQGENILAITFSKKAAGEMAARIRRAGDARAAKVEVHTYHDFCYKLLRRHDEALKILDDIDYWIFLRRRLDRLGLDLFKKLSSPGHFLNDFKQFFSRCQDELVSPADYNQYVRQLTAGFEKEKPLLADDERAKREEEVLRQQEVARVYAAAEELLREARLTTFGGSLLSAVHLLESSPQLLAQYQDRFRYIVVDEYQDANIAQIRLLELLAGRHRNIMVVGDDDQAIYRFRGASYASFKKFMKLFDDCRRIPLSQNYRSTARILHVAGELIAQNGDARFDKNKKLLPAHPGGTKVQLAEFEGQPEEAAYVRREIQRLQKETGAYSGIAVLYRSHVHRNLLVEELARAGIPFVVRKLSILSSPLVRDLLAYLRAIHSPEDNISLARLLAIPAWGLSADGLRELIARARKEKVSLAKAIESLHPRVRDQQTRLGALLKLLVDLRSHATKRSLTELFDELLEHLGVRLLPPDPDLPYLETFVQFLRDWEKEKSETKRLAEFLEYLDYFREAGGSVVLPDEPQERDAVQLMTVHSAKGLEFESVFVLRLNRSDFPTKKRTPLFEFPEALMNEPLPPGDFRIQEERRLCYVAFTRARRRLTLTTLTGKRKNPSVFLEDILRDPRIAREIEQLDPPPAPPPSGDAMEPSPLAPRLFGREQTPALYSRIGEWAADNTGIEVPEPLHLSHSTIKTYTNCPLKYKLHQLWQLSGVSNPAMIFGLIMHRSLVDYFRARQKRSDLPLEELQHIYEQQWRAVRWPSRDSYQEEEYRSSGWQQLQTFHEKHAGQPLTVLAMEKNFEWKWEDVVLTGRIDQINKLGGRNVEIVEYKTGEPEERKKTEKSKQLALYALAAEKQLNLTPKRLTLYNLTSNEPVSFEPAEKILTKTLDDVRIVAAQIRAGEFPATPNYFCRSCDYFALCPAQEQNLTFAAAPPQDTQTEIPSSQ